jgi:hypothetical protein
MPRQTEKPRADIQPAPDSQEQIRKQLEQAIRERAIKVTNQKARIFDIIEDKSRIQNEIAQKQGLVEKLGQQILEEQRVLEGDRKVLRDLEEQKRRDFPEITVEK